MIQQARFGRTGHTSTRTIFGAAALAQVDQSEADRTLDVLLQFGVNHIDVAASYGDAELRIGPWMGRHRQDFFLATKTGQRTANEARDELHRSLDRLRTDYVDLWQLHNLVDSADWDTALSPGGALEAAIEAREQGLVRAIGVTGHGSSVAAQHRRSLERFDFDSVLLPYSYITMQDSYYAENLQALLRTCGERNVAVQTIKSIARRPWLGRERTRTVWYEPLEDRRSIELSVHWVLGNPDVFLNTVGDTHILPLVLEAADRFQSRPTDEEMRSVLQQEEMAPLFV